jgi:hypothetical protein
MTVNVDNWMEWAKFNGVYPSMISYIRKYPRMLWNFDPDRESRSFATPRSVTNAAKIHKVFGTPKDRSDRMLLDLSLCGVVGSGLAGNYMAFVDNELALVGPEEIMKDPEGCRLPASIDAFYATSDALIHYLMEHRQAKCVEAAMTYVLKFKQNDLKVACLKSIIEKVIVVIEDRAERTSLLGHSVMKEVLDVIDKLVTPGQVK